MANQAAAVRHVAPVKHSYWITAGQSGTSERNTTQDMSQLTPEELRLVAQDNYAKAIASLEKEGAEIEVERHEIASELEGLVKAKEAARRAVDETRKAKSIAEKLRARAAAADNKTGLEAGRAAEESVTKESAHFDSATKAYEDAAAAEAALLAKIADLDRKKKELRVEALELESARDADAGIDANLQSAKAQLAAAEELAAAEASKRALAARADAAARAADDAKARLAAASGDPDRARVAGVKEEYERATEALARDKSELAAAEGRIQNAKVEISKQDQAAAALPGGASSPRRLTPRPRPAPAHSGGCGAPAASAIVASAASVSLLASL